MNITIEKFTENINEIISTVSFKEKNKIKKIAKILSDKYLIGHHLYVFGTGHNHCIAEESLHRAGAFAGVTPILDKKMDRINLLYLRLLIFNCSVYFLNLVATIKLLKDGYHSMSTISCFASFVLLVLMKLFNSLTVAYQSVKNDKMMSAYMCEFVSYNVLDKDYVEAKQKELGDVETDGSLETTETLEETTETLEETTLETLKSLENIPERDYSDGGSTGASLEEIIPVLDEID